VGSQDEMLWRLLQQAGEGSPLGLLGLEPASRVPAGSGKSGRPRALQAAQVMRRGTRERPEAPSAEQQ